MKPKKAATTLLIATVGLLALSSALAGCASIADPTNAEGRAEKMKKAMDAQKHNGMMTAPKTSQPTN